MKVKGLADLDKKLGNMEKKVAKKIVRSAVRKAQNITKKKAKANAQSMVGGEMGQKIAGALKVKSVNKQKKGSYALQVAIDPTKADEFVHYTKDGKRYYIPTAVEYGHKKVGGGKVAPIGYMREASDATEKQRVNTMISEIKKGVDSA